MVVGYGREQAIQEKGLRLLRRAGEHVDHVVPRSFFLDAERGPGLRVPQVAACARCNNEKSKLEAYVSSALLIASRHPEANRYRREKVAPRLDRNQKLRAELNVDARRSGLRSMGFGSRFT